MKVRNLFFAVLASAAVLAGCQEKEEDLGAPSIKVEPSAVTFDQGGQSHKVAVTASRDWKVVETTIPAGWSVDPMQGTASTKATEVTVTAPANEGLDINSKIKFSAGVVDAVLTVSQAGPGGDPADLLVYFNDFDKEEATKTYGSSGTYWPYLDQFEGWKNQTGSGAANVSYEFKGASARANSFPKEGAGLSGSNNIMISKTAGSFLQINEIELSADAVNYQLSFGAWKYSGTNLSNEYTKVYISNDAAKWVELKWTATELPEEKFWTMASHTFTVPANTAKLYVHFANNDAANDARIEDVRLAISTEAGENIDFSTGTEIGGGTTEPEPEPDPNAIFEESFATSQGEFTIEDKTLPAGFEYIWKHDPEYGMKASAYNGADKTNHASESWLISPAIDLTSEKVASLNFDHAGNFFGDIKSEISLKITTDDGANWFNLAIPVYPAGNNWNFVASGDIDLSDYLGKTIKIAFIYTSTDAKAGTYELKNVKVLRKEATTEPEPEPVEGVVIQWTSSSDWTGIGGDEISYEQDGYSIVVKKEKGQTKPTVNGSANDCRAYAKATITITGASAFKSVVFNVSKKGMYRLAPITADSGEVAAQALGDDTVSWTGNATTVTFTVGDKADYGSDGAEKAGQLCFDNIVIGQ